MINALTLLFVSLATLLMPQKAELVFVGDAMQHQSQLDAARSKGGVYDYSECFEQVRPYVESADLAVVNLETTLGGKNYTGYPMFCSPDSYARALKDAGFDLFLLANNHMLDRRDRGVKRTVSVLDSMKVLHVGAYADKEYRSKNLPLVKDVKGFKVAFLNYTYGTNGIPVQGDVVIDYIDLDKMKSDVAAARKAGAELVAVCVHWGVEYSLLPTAAQKRLADKIAALDVDMIIGGHPHVIEPMEMRERADGRKQFLVYSLGNFISGMRTADTRGGAMTRVTLERDSLGKAYVADANYRLVFVASPGNGGKNYRLVEAAKEGPAGTEHWRKSFYSNDKRVRERHNVNVPMDTVPLESYGRR